MVVVGEVAAGLPRFQLCQRPAASRFRASHDGTCLDVADTPENAAAFGRPGTQRGHGVGAFPQLRLVGLAECGTHAITSAAFGPCTSSEVALAA